MNFIHSIDRENRNKENAFRDLRGQVDDKIIEQMMESDNITLREMRKTYGDNMNAYSRVEAYIKILQASIKPKGIYILDEPEAALSPLKQISLIFLIKEIRKSGQSQFIISSHSPILMVIPRRLLIKLLMTKWLRYNLRKLIITE